MSVPAYLDLHRKLARLSDRDYRDLAEEFDPRLQKTPDSLRIAYLAERAPRLLRRARSGHEPHLADRLVMSIGYGRRSDMARKLLALLIDDLAPGVHAHVVEQALLTIGRSAAGAVHERLVAVARGRYVPKATLHALVRVTARLHDTRSIPTLLACLRRCPVGHSVMLDALKYLTLGRDQQRREVLEFVQARATPQPKAIEKQLWPGFGNDPISRLRLQILRGKYKRALRRFAAMERSRVQPTLFGELELPPHHEASSN